MNKLTNFFKNLDLVKTGFITITLGFLLIFLDSSIFSDGEHTETIMGTIGIVISVIGALILITPTIIYFKNK